MFLFLFYTVKVLPVIVKNCPRFFDQANILPIYLFRLAYSLNLSIIRVRIKF